ncbi:MAG: DUF1987 domain-containing protein [Bacteroidales bacterium]|nr:DUF1987 domain-containing protein [Bacteroidales bacterium]
MMKLFKPKVDSGFQNLVLNKTHNTPEVRFNKNGILDITGRLIPENSHVFFDALIDWVRKLEVNQVKINSRLEYINTSSTKGLLKFFQEIEQNPKVNQVEVDWYFEEDDYDLKETGELFESYLDFTVFNYNECIDLEI